MLHNIIILKAGFIEVNMSFAFDFISDERHFIY